MAKLDSLKAQWDRRFPDPSESRVAAIRRLLPRFPTKVNFMPRRTINPQERREDISSSPTGHSSVSPTAPVVQNPVVPDSDLAQPLAHDVYVGSVKINMNRPDNIADAFLNSTRKTLRFIPPSIQRDEIIIQPTSAMVEVGSKRWQATAVGYFLGKKPFFPHVEAFAKANWKGLQRVSATANGFFFFQFKTVAFMEEVIEEGPWLFQGQPVVLQAWEQGMSLRRQKHLQVPVWVRFRHLPLEYWTAEGLSAVASGIGSPLYTDKVTQACSRLDYARCCSLGHNVKSCPESRVKKAAASVSVFVQKQNSTQVATSSPGVDLEADVDAGLEADVESDLNADGDMVNSSANKGTTSLCLLSCFPPSTIMARLYRPLRMVFLIKAKKWWSIIHLRFWPDELASMIKAAVWNVRGLNSVGHQEAVGQLVLEHNIQFLGLLETRVRQVNINSVRSNLLRNWSWFDDYSGPGGRIWLVWNAVDVDVEVLRVETQFIHCKVTNKAMHTTCLMTVVYGECDIIPRRELWAGLCLLSGSLSDEPWCVLGDFNAVIDASEICGTSADVSNAMAEFQDCITAAALVHLSFTGCLFSWHNCREGVVVFGNALTEF
ncbi:UNVERIFIED_CONTAM: hypothetical protein Sradi_7286300 [Sesamum radiatum]|uniref:DUF4283 domain-containing protein n=1 Tax=Sesamum radiatum TaxID=300843 RepID=A0AAW2IHX5_SESRA